MFGAAGTVLKAVHMFWVIATFPAIKGLWADIKVPAGKAGIASVRMVIIKPLQSPGGLF
jgi:hypothetical protein